jgi:hypothetical protein
MSEEEHRLLEEDRLLRLYGLHLAYDPEDAAEFPAEFPERGEVWQLGSREEVNTSAKETEYFTREEALAYVREREERKER